mmetsp:Transcript_73255/g.172149  ORF Transcript_73255/g.172149 Transcript_73255/m.172149 type:complete len:100 (-) Transcript_73255:19-318(-)
MYPKCFRASLLQLSDGLGGGTTLTTMPRRGVGLVASRRALGGDILGGEGRLGSNPAVLPSTPQPTVLPAMFHRVACIDAGLTMTGSVPDCGRPCTGMTT